MKAPRLSYAVADVLTYRRGGQQVQAHPRPMTMPSTTTLLFWICASTSCSSELERAPETPTSVSRQSETDEAQEEQQDDREPAAEEASEQTIPRSIESFPPAPKVPTGPLAPDLAAAIDVTFGQSLHDGSWGDEQIDALEVIATSGDPRSAWIVSDLLRISTDPQLRALLALTAFVVLDLDADLSNAWGTVTDHLIAWDIPAPPNYLGYKRNVFTLVVPEWERIFQPGAIDWRHVTWGGVRIDKRPFDQTDELCNCIPAADNPPVTGADEADWLDDDDVVFGVAVGEEYRAYPRQIMEVREMVNDTLGGRHIGMPYCTLCGSAQAYFTDRLPEGVERPVLRTSGLLIRSNKVMFDLNTYSVFDTFLGTAVTGPLADKGIVLPQAGVVTTTWGEWKRAHPTTTVLVEDLALGRDFDFRNGRDAHGPIFPIGDMDPRLAVHDDVVGIVTDSGTPIAFPVVRATEALKQGKSIAFENVRLRLDAGGLRAVGEHGEDLGGHQAFWFAWSQFHPGTLVWSE